MKWIDLLGHQAQKTWFQNAIAQNRLASAFLFVGPDGIGKRAFARLIAKTLLCLQQEPALMDPCDQCEACAQINASTHPDLLQIAKPSDKTVIPLDLLIGSTEARLREGLCHDIHLKPYSGRRKIAIIDDADFLAKEGANSLLKTLEEPPPGAVIFLIGTSEQRQLATIRSRCQIVRFQPLSETEVITLLNRHGWVHPMYSVPDAARLAQGCMNRIVPLNDESVADFRVELFKQLSARPMNFVKLAKAISSNVESVGQEGILRRERLKLILGFATDYYREAMYLLSGYRSEFVEHAVQQMIGSTSSRWPAQSEAAVRAIQRCLKAVTEVDRNLSSAGILESWASDLAQLCHA